MRKLFRMKYESCSGQCYQYSDVMRIHTLGLDAQGAAAFLRRLLDMHRPSCGNPNIEFRLDVDEWKVEHPDESWPPSKDRNGNIVSKPWFSHHARFVASFYHYGSLDLFAGDTPLEAMNKMIDAALAWYASDEGKVRLVDDSPAHRASVCHHGTDQKLVEFAIEFSGLDADGRAALREQFA